MTCVFKYIVLIALILIGLSFSAVLGNPSCGATSEPHVVRVNGTVEKVCQLIGDVDYETGQPTISLTNTRYSVLGTDLGVSFSHNGELIFLFGDTAGRFLGLLRDSFAHAQIPSYPAQLNLTFFTDDDGKYLYPTVPGITQGAFEVPMEGVDVHGTAYVFFTTNHTSTEQMGSSIVAKFNDSDASFTFLYFFSFDKFKNVHVVKVNNSAVGHLPQGMGEGLLIFGSGDYRHSDPYLAWMPLNSIEDWSSVKYFTGLDGSGNPVWGSNESNAAPLFHDPVIGELSVQYNPYLQRWVMLYSGVSMRSSLLPWGPWSGREELFGFGDGGFGHFMHWPGHDNVTDSIHDGEWGGAYGPYLVDELTTGHGNTTTVYFTMSTWNPYVVVLMKAQLTMSAGAEEQPIQQGSSFPFLTLILMATVVVIVIGAVVALALRSYKAKK